MAAFSSALLAGLCLIAVALPSDSCAAENRRNTGGSSPVATEAVVAGESRIALVIGNGNYRSSPLPNPVNDARAIGGVLKDLGFRVRLLENATLKEMSDAARDFGDLLQQGGVGLFLLRRPRRADQGTQFSDPRWGRYPARG
ncbi:MAG: caspase family protein [Betaproteobacteria bacterium]|nr:caspase family protein [Betaproteobacteria bacterium]